MGIVAEVKSTELDAMKRVLGSVVPFGAPIDLSYDPAAQRIRIKFPGFRGSIGESVYFSLGSSAGERIFQLIQRILRHLYRHLYRGAPTPSLPSSGITPWPNLIAGNDEIRVLGRRQTAAGTLPSNSSVDKGSAT